MKRSHPFLGAVVLALLASACSGGVQIQTLATANASGLKAAASAAADERDLGGRAALRTSVSVLPFDVTTTDSSFAPIGYGFADLLLTDLAVSHQLTVVDRTHMDQVRQELSLASQSTTDRATALRLGRTVAARDLVLGSLDLPADSSLHFQTNIAEVASGKVAVALAGSGGLDQMFDAEKQLVMKLFDQLGVKLTNAELTKLDQSPRTNTKAFVAYSAGVRAESRGDWVAAQAAYDRAIAIDPKFTPAVDHKAAVAVRAAVKQSSASAAPTADAARAAVKPDTAAVKLRAAKPAAKSGAAGSAVASAVSSSVPAAAPAAPPSSPVPPASAKSVQSVTPPVAPAASASPTVTAAAAPSFARANASVAAAPAGAMMAAGANVKPSNAARAVRSPPMTPARRDSIVRARREARRDSVLAVAKHKADSLKAARAALAAARRDSVRAAVGAQKSAPAPKPAQPKRPF